MLLSVQNPNGCVDCFIPKKYKVDDDYNVEMDNLENKMMDETMKPFINSGHAFICFDSVKSLNIILKHFRITPTQHIKIFLVGIKDKLNSWWMWITRQ